jgi:peptidoglycan glycosyltransferase
VGLAFLAASFALRGEAALESGKERLLADDPRGARSALASARRWPGTAARAEVGLALVAALEGLPPDAAPTLTELRAFRPIVLLDGALARGDLGALRALAQVLLRARHPLGPLYAAAAALERGDETEARALLVTSPASLAGHPLGRRIADALDAEARGGVRLVRDRVGRTVGALDADGGFRLAEGLDPLLVEAPLDVLAWPPGHRGGVRLTLDLDLARLCLDALGRWRGTIVLLEPRTGAVLAAVSDARTARREGAAAFRQRREPASIAKLVTTAAAYRAGIDADEAISHMTCTGVERFGGQPLWCPWAAGPLAGLDQALAVSCNIAFARLGVRVGRDRLVAELRRWGFDDEDEDLLGAAGHIHPMPRNARQLADLSIGLTFSDITPLHAALLAAVVADGGTLPRPRLVSGPCGPLGFVDLPAPLLPGRRVIEPSTARRLAKAMRAVALYGTGTGLAPRGFPVAMKTGTAAAPGKGYHVNYVGFAPFERPTVVFCVRVTNRPSSHAVTRAAREVAASLLAGLADRRFALASAARRQRALRGLASD